MKSTKHQIKSLSIKQETKHKQQQRNKTTTHFFTTMTTYLQQVLT